MSERKTSGHKAKAWLWKQIPKWQETHRDISGERRLLLFLYWNTRLLKKERELTLPMCLAIILGHICGNRSFKSATLNLTCWCLSELCSCSFGYRCCKAGSVCSSTPLTASFAVQDWPPMCPFLFSGHHKRRWVMANVWEFSIGKNKTKQKKKKLTIIVP